MITNTILDNTPEEKQKRLALCESCEYKKVGNIDVCGKTNDAIIHLISYKFTTCPIGKW